MNHIQELIGEKSKLISKAQTLQILGKVNEAKMEYKKAAYQEKELALKFEKIEPSLAKLHWISAISCAMEAEEFIDMFIWIENFEKRDGIDDEEKELLKKIKNIAFSKIKYEKSRFIDQSLERRILKYLLLKNEERFQKIRGKGNIIKELYFIEEEMLKYGKTKPSNYIVALNPIFNIELSNQIDIYISNKYLIRNPDKTLNLSRNIKKKLENEKEIIERIIIKNFSAKFLQNIIKIVQTLGNLTSLELKQFEKKKGITSYQYGRKL